MSDVPIPPELLTEILSRLPVTPLLRFRSVSKTLRALIDSHHLINLHLNHSFQTNSNTNLIFSGDGTLCHFDLDSPANAVNDTPNPLYFSIFDSIILGSCNGVLCLCTSEPENEIALWNPSVRKFSKTRLPAVKFVEGFCIPLCIKGFGYDHVHDEYKVVRLAQYCSIFDELVYSTIQVFSLKNGDWGEIRVFPYHLFHQIQLNVFVTGCLHWLVSLKPDLNFELMIAAMNLTNHEIQLISLPDSITENVDVKVNLGVIGGMLCVVCNYPELHNVEVWVMKNYGVRDSWSKLISTADVRIVRELDFLRPIAYSKSGYEVLLEINFQRLYWYDLRNNVVKRLKVCGMPRFFVTQVFVGGLVEVKIGSDSQNAMKKKEDKNDRKKDDFLSEGFRLVL